MSNLYTGHEAEMTADREATYTKEQRAASYLKSAIEAINPGSYLDFLSAPTAAEMAENAIRNAQKAIDILKS